METPSLNRVVPAIVGIIAIVGASIGAYNFFAHADELKVVEMRLDYKILGDMAYDIRREMNQIEDRNKTTDCLKMVPVDRTRYRKLYIQLEDLEKKIDVMRTLQIGGKG